MRNSNAFRFALCILAGLAANVLEPAYSFATADELCWSPSSLTCLLQVRWPAGAPITYAVNANGVSGFTSDLQKLVIVGAVNDAFRAWAGIPQASIQFTNSGASQATGTDTAGADGVNTISFQDPNKTVLFRPGTLAVTTITVAVTGGQAMLGDKVVNAVPGQMLDADITFDPSIAFSPNGASGADLEAILLHEIGHLLGLGHTAILSSIMNPFGEAGSGVASRNLQSDDILSAAALYPNPGFSPAPGSISGVILDASASPLKSAHVVAMSVPGGVPLESQLTGADGSYLLAALPPGSYQLFVEPLNGAVTLSDFPGFYSADAQTNFSAAWYGGSLNPTIFTVNSGQTTQINFEAAGGTSVLNATLFASAPQSQASLPPFTPSAQYLLRGDAYQLSAAGATLTTQSFFQFSAPSSQLTLQGQATSPNATLGTLNIRTQNLSISPSAALGPSNYLLTNNSSTVVISGGVVITVNPQIPAGVNGVLDGASFGNKLAPGTIFSIFGTDLSPRTENWLGAPAPTSLGGISVKVGNSLAPLFYASPTQINGMIPFEITGSSATVAVEAGPHAEGTAVNVALSPTAPAIFTAGGNQGAILNGSDSTVAAPASAFPPGAARPARPGDVIVVYATGLGPVTPALPTGLASGVNGSSFPQLARLPQVAIGGQPVPAANIQFAGLSPGFVGLYQLNVQLPPGIPAGDAIPVEITTAEGQGSNTPTMAISQ